MRVLNVDKLIEAIHKNTWETTAQPPGEIVYKETLLSIIEAMAFELPDEKPKEVTATNIIIPTEESDITNDVDENVINEDNSSTGGDS